MLPHVGRQTYKLVMTSASKIFVSLRPIRKSQSKHQEPTGPKCQWDLCEKAGTHRAPVGREGEGLFLLFCPARVAEYTKGYNFSSALSDPVTA